MNPLSWFMIIVTLYVHRLKGLIPGLIAILHNSTVCYSQEYDNEKWMGGYPFLYTMQMHLRIFDTYNSYLHCYPHGQLSLLHP